MAHATANFDAVANIKAAGLGACFSVGEPPSHDGGRRRKREGLTRSSLRRQRSAQHEAEEADKVRNPDRKGGDGMGARSRWLRKRGGTIARAAKVCTCYREGGES